MRRISATAIAGLFVVLMATLAADPAQAGNCWVRAQASQRGALLPVYSEWYPGDPAGGCTGQGGVSACCEVFPYWIPQWGTPVKCLGTIEDFCLGEYDNKGWIDSMGYGLQHDVVCPWTNFFRRDTAQCIAPRADKDPQSCPRTPNPISLANRNKFEAETDLELPGGLRIARTYNSKDAVRGWGQIANGWSMDLRQRINFNGAAAYAIRPSGRILYFVVGSTSVTADKDVNDRLIPVRDSGGAIVGWTYYEASSDRFESYDASGKLTRITSREGLVWSLAYTDGTATGPTGDVARDSSGNPLDPPIAVVAGLPLTLTDPWGRNVRFGYDAAVRPVVLIGHDGRAIVYRHDRSGNLVSVQHQDGTLRQYVYNEPDNTASANLGSALTGIVDELGARFGTYRYTAVGDAVGAEHAGGVDAYAISYDSATQVTVIDPLATQRTFGFATSPGLTDLPRTTGVSEPASACGATDSSVGYDANGNVASRIDFNGSKVCYGYDLSRNLETARVEGALSTEACSTVLAALPARADVGKVSTQWHANWRLPVKMTEPNRLTTFAYNGDGGHFCAPSGAKANGIPIGVLCSKTVQATTDVTGQQGLAATPTGTARVWSYTYDSFGHVLTATDPNNRKTSTAYYAANDADLGKRGNVRTITNPAGHVTTVTAYDASGRPLSITDPNGLVTTLAYDARGRLTSRQVGVERTGYLYDGVGQLTQVTLPDGSYLQYTYDGAHRLTQISDGLGNRIVYTLDNMGNRLEEQVYDPDDNLTQARSRTYDALNRLREDLGALGQTTTYGHDNNGNLTSVTDPLLHPTTNTYDALNRLTQVLDPGKGITRYAYDGANNLIQVTDPRNLATTYTFDGLHDLVKQLSPDTGTTTSTYDAAGNLKTRLDARGVTATYTYDPINRVSRIVYSKTGTTSETHTFTYDSGGNAKGRLTQIVDTAATTTWTYGSQGHVATKAQKIGTLAHTVTYAYNTAGQLATLTTPSGQKVGYEYTNNRISKITVNGQTLLSAAIAQPFGPIAAWNWSNGLFTFRDYDSDGRLATWEFRDGVSILRKDQSFDAASRIVGIADPDHPTASQTYQYDALDRLSVAQAGNPVTGTQQFVYDAVGNRLSKTADGGLTNYTYPGTANQLLALTGATTRSYTYDGAGNPTAIGGLTYTYNNANRLVAIKNGSTTVASYLVNALGQRAQKTVGATTTRFVYDEQGHLLGEYDGAGKLVQETVWLEDLPVATLRPTGAAGTPTPINVYYVHADHLGSARAVTRSSDNAIMWQWDNIDPFGANAADENPAGQGTFKYGLRFPGQYYDAETATHYNYFRDYDPSIGRYIESDPIGLRGGLNNFGYVGSEPISNFDPKGYIHWPRLPDIGTKGCGSGAGRGIPDVPLWTFNFKQCCFDHDDCYDDCKNQPTKEQCDGVFCRCLIAECNRHPEAAEFCLGLAGIYCSSAEKLGKLSRQCGLPCVGTSR